MKTRKVKLQLADRFAVLDALPRHGTYVQMQITRSLSEALNVKPIEIEAKELKADGNNLSWNSSKDTPEEFELSRLEVAAIVDGLKKLDTDGKLEPRHLNAYEVFVNGK